MGVICVALTAMQGLTGFLGAGGGDGIFRAWAQGQQEGSEDTAAAKRQPASGGASGGMDSFTELIDQRKVSREFLRDLEARTADIKRREAALEEREKALERVRRDIEEKLALVEQKRNELEALTKKIDQTREKELKQAVNIYRAMEPEASAQVFLEMDLEFAAAVLRRLDVDTAGAIYNAMVELAAQTGTDSDANRKIKELGEFLVNPTKFRAQKTGQAAPATK